MLTSLAIRDVVLLNDPYNGGTHLPDLILVSPAFSGTELIGHTVAIAHMIDVMRAYQASVELTKSGEDLLKQAIEKIGAVPQA